MSDVAGELLVKITPDARGFAKQVEKDTESAGTKAGQGISGRMLSGMLAKASGVITVGATIGAGFRTGMDNEVAQIKFTQLLGSTKLAEGYISDLKDFAAKTPFDFPGIQEAAGRFLAVGTEAGRVIPIMTTLGDATAMMGTGAEGVDRATTALTQMAQKGKVTGEEMMQLTEAGVPAWDALSAQMGMPVDELQKLVSKGLVPADEMFKAIEGTAGDSLKSMSGGMAKMSETTMGQWSTLKDTAEQTLGTLMMPLVNAAAVALDWINNTLVPGIAKVPDFFNQWKTPITVIAGIITTVMLPALVLWAVQAVTAGAAQVAAFASTMGSALAAGATMVATGIVIVASWIASAAAAMVSAVTIAAAWLIALGPIGLIIAGVVAIVAVFVVLWNKVDGFKQFWVKVWDIIWDAINWVWAWIKKNWPMLLAILTGPIGIAVALIIKYWDQIKVAAQTAWNWIKSVVSAVVDAIKGYITTFRTVVLAAWTAIKAAAQTAWDAIKGKIDAVISLVTGVINGFRSTVTGVWNTIRAKAAEAWDGIKAAISAKIAEVVSLVSTLPAKIKGALSGAATMLVGKGKDIVTGLWNGISSMAGWIRNKVIGFISSVLPGPVKKALGISSPSKVFAEIGEEVPAGLALGLEAGTADVERSVNNMLAPLAAPGGGFNVATGDLVSAAPVVQVFIGDQEIEDFIVRVQDRANALAATRLLSGVGGGYR